MRFLSGRTERDFARAKPHIGGKPMTWAEARAAAAKIGRPKSYNPRNPSTFGSMPTW